MSHVEAAGEQHEPGIRSGVFQIVRVYAADIANLPPPGEEWKYANTDLDKSTYKRLQAKDIVTKTRHYKGDTASLWTIDKRAYEIAQEIVSKPGRLSCCGGSGITNDGGDIRCSRCGTEVPEEELDRVFG